MVGGAGISHKHSKIGPLSRQQTYTLRWTQPFTEARVREKSGGKQCLTVNAILKIVVDGCGSATTLV